MTLVNAVPFVAFVVAQFTPNSKIGSLVRVITVCSIFILSSSITTFQSSYLFRVEIVTLCMRLTEPLSFEEHTSTLISAVEVTAESPVSISDDLGVLSCSTNLEIDPVKIFVWGNENASTVFFLQVRISAIQADSTFILWRQLPTPPQYQNQSKNSRPCPDSVTCWHTTALQQIASLMYHVRLIVC